MKYRVVQRINPLNKEESKFYAAPQYAEDVDSSSITSKRILFTPSTELKSEIESASFSRIEGYKVSMHCPI